MSFRSTERQTPLTVLCFSLLMRDRLCSISVNSGNTVVQATLSYEER
ncbi:Hok/Gef family protein [Proteus mirabilis]